MRGLDGVGQVADPFARGGAVSRDGTIASVDVRYTVEPTDLDKQDGEALEAAARTAEAGGVDAAARGILIDLASEQEAPVGELIGVGIAILLLTLLFRSLAAMAATLVGAVVVSALTILPIMMGALARRLKPRKAAHVQTSAAFARWGALITARPWVSIAAGVLLLLVFALPVTQLRLGQPDDGNQPASKTQRVAYDQLSKAFGPGSNGSLLLAVDTPRATRTPPASSARCRRPWQGRPASRPSPRRPRAATARRRRSSRSRRPRPRTRAPAGAAARGRHPARDARHPAEGLHRRQHRGLRGLLRQGGLTPAGVHRGRHRALGAAADRRLPLALGPARLRGLQPAVGRRGLRRGGGGLPGGLRRKPALGVDSGVPIVSFIPVMLFAILFGLSTDYNVFLLSRVHEAYNEGDRPRESVIHGLSRIGKVIMVRRADHGRGVPRLHHAARRDREE